MIWFACYPAHFPDLSKVCWRCDVVKASTEIGLCSECYQVLRDDAA